jgi:hypothetical protein
LLANAYAAPDIELGTGKPETLEPVDGLASNPINNRFAQPPLADVAMVFQQQLEKHPQFRGRGRLVYSEFHDGVLRLTGCLPSFYLKQQVQALAHRMPAVTRVVNRIDVRDAICRDGELETWWIGTHAGPSSEE